MIIINNLDFICKERRIAICFGWERSVWCGIILGKGKCKSHGICCVKGKFEEEMAKEKTTES